MIACNDGNVWMDDDATFDCRVLGCVVWYPDFGCWIWEPATMAMLVWLRVVVGVLCVWLLMWTPDWVCVCNGRTPDRRYWCSHGRVCGPTPARVCQHPCTVGAIVDRRVCVWHGDESRNYMMLWCHVSSSCQVLWCICIIRSVSFVSICVIVSFVVCLLVCWLLHMFESCWHSLDCLLVSCWNVQVPVCACLLDCWIS